MRLTTTLGEDPGGYPPQSVPSYALADVHQLQATRLPEVRPPSRRPQEAQARALAMDAALYGWPSVLQYVHLHDQAVDRGSPTYTGFGVLAHDRELAGPGYRAFKTPNADTLYSNAWLDLGDGPVLVELPAFGDRYYTLSFLDMHSNATNLSTGTVGGQGGRCLVATTDWKGEVPDGLPVFRVATRWMWLLLRVFVSGAEDLPAARALQDGVRLTPLSTGTTPPPAFPTATADAVRSDWQAFFPVLDFVLRTTAHPNQEDALVYRYRALGLGTGTPWDAGALDDADRAGMAAGWADALTAVVDARASLGSRIPGTGWSRGRPASYGFNYLRRAATNHVGLGATVVQENQPFMGWFDGDGAPLDGTTGSYELAVPVPPPVDAFWSVTVNDARTLELHPNQIGRYRLSDRTTGIRYDDDGTLRIRLQHHRPDPDGNWLPVPAGPFYLALRAYLPRPDLLEGRWSPEPVRRTGGAP